MERKNPFFVTFFLVVVVMGKIQYQNPLEKGEKKPGNDGEIYKYNQSFFAVVFSKF